MSSLNIQPLPPGQQMLLQRLMATHIMSNDTAKQTVVSLVQEVGEDGMGSEHDNSITLGGIFSSINQQLHPGFGLEIVTMVDKSEGEKPVKYHAIVNTQCDDIAKQHAFEKAYTPHERAFIRLLLSQLVEEGLAGGMKRKDCINMRSQLDNGFKLKLDEAERLVQTLLDEQWLRISTHQDESDDEENESDDDNENSQPKKRQKKERQRRRRESVQNKLELAPRAYMELSHYLINLGLDEEDMPQFLFHRS